MGAHKTDRCKFLVAADERDVPARRPLEGLPAVLKPGVTVTSVALVGAPGDGNALFGLPGGDAAPAREADVRRGRSASAAGPGGVGALGRRRAAAVTGAAGAVRALGDDQIGEVAADFTGLGGQRPRP